MVNFAALITDIALPDSLAQLPITELQLDSRCVKRGDLFVALQGHQQDGRNYIASAIQSGAVAVLSHEGNARHHGEVQFVNGVPVIGFYALDKQLSALAHRCYFSEAPLRTCMKVVGVTGTNGKSTVTHLMASWLSLLGYRTAVMGTLGNGLVDAVSDNALDLTASANTTGDAISIARQLAEFNRAGVDLVAMEVSSHGLHQHRVAAVPFEQAVFTNLSRDHLDYHTDMQEYEDVKRLLFKMQGLNSRIINSDDPVGLNWLQHHADAISYGFTPRGGNAQLLGSNLRYSHNGIAFTVHWAGKQHDIAAPLLGAFNGQNILAALCGLQALGYPLDELLARISALSGVPGRMERFAAPGSPLVVVDYAHTPDALQKALTELRQHSAGKVWVIFGCGGDRDRGKRALMGTIAQQSADQIVITDDNPRSESPATIAAEICSGITNNENVQIIHDREQAIRHCFEQAKADDLILIAGKGHENYQILADSTRDFSDRDLAHYLVTGEKQ